jgi:hypothetical protein
MLLVKNCNLLITRHPKRTSKRQEKTSSLKREHPAQSAISNTPVKLFIIIKVIISCLSFCNFATSNYEKADVSNFRKKMKETKAHDPFVGLLLPSVRKYLLCYTE